MRVASKIGKGFNGSLCNNLSDSAYLNNRQSAQQAIMINELVNTVYPSDTIRFTDSIPFGEVITEYNSYWHNGLIPDYMFNAKELDEESNMYYYSARYYAPPTFISRDPLFEKYPWESPYTYCGNNPVIYIDPNGREKINGFSKTGGLFYKSTQKAIDDKAIRIHAHGSPIGFTAVFPSSDGTAENTIPVRTAEQFISFLSEHSETWKNRKEGEHVTIILLACNTGQDITYDDSYTETSFAQRMSEDPAFKNVTIIAANSTVMYTESGEQYVSNTGSYNKGAYQESIGKWMAFREGKKIGEIPGNKGNDVKPMNIPSWVSDILLKLAE